VKQAAFELGQDSQGFINSITFITATNCKSHRQNFGMPAKVLEIISRFCANVSAFGCTSMYSLTSSLNWTYFAPQHFDYDGVRSLRNPLQRTETQQRLWHRRKQLAGLHLLRCATLWRGCVLQRRQPVLYERACILGISSPYNQNSLISNNVVPRSNIHVDNPARMPVLNLYQWSMLSRLHC